MRLKGAAKENNCSKDLDLISLQIYVNLALVSTDWGEGDFRY